MKTIWLVTSTTKFGTEVFYAGAANAEEALLMAAERDHYGDHIQVKQIPNKFGIQQGQWQSAI